MDETREEAAKVVVCDAGPLIHLDELNCLGLLADFVEVLVPATVWKEVARHRPNALMNSTVPFNRIEIAEPIRTDLAALGKSLSLHAGELAALHLAQERHVDLMLTDDTAARLAAVNLSIPVHGTLGILLRAIRRNQKPAMEIVTLLRELPTRSTLHIKQSLLDEVIVEVKKISPTETQDE